MTRMRGTTLIEILIAGSLLVLLIGVAAATLIPALRAWMRSQAQSEAQQDAFLVVSRLNREVLYANPDSISIQNTATTDPDTGLPVPQNAMLFLSSVDGSGQIHLDSGGDPLWQKRVVVYHTGATQEVRYQSIPLTTPVTDPNPLQVTAFTPNPQDRVIARHVRSLLLTMRGQTLDIAVDTRTETISSHLESSVSPIVAGVDGLSKPPVP